MIFRRIHGRIVPIKEYTAQKEGAAIAGAGVATAVIAGKAGASFHRDAAHAENASRRSAKQAMAFKRTKKNIPAFKVLAKDAFKSGIEAKKLSSTGTAIKNLGNKGASALIAGGVYRGLEDTKLSKTEKAGVATGAGLVSHAIIKTSYTKSIGGLSFLKSAKHAIKRVLIKRLAR